MIQAELGQVAASIETLVARQTNLEYKLSKLSEREDDLADTCESTYWLRCENEQYLDPMAGKLTLEISLDCSGRHQRQTGNYFRRNKSIGWRT